MDNLKRLGFTNSTVYNALPIHVVTVPVQREADLPAGGVLCADSNCVKQSL